MFLSYRVRRLVKAGGSRQGPWAEGLAKFLPLGWNLWALKQKVPVGEEAWGLVCVVLGVWLLPGLPFFLFSLVLKSRGLTSCVCMCRWKMAPVSLHSTSLMSLGVSVCLFF